MKRILLATLAMTLLSVPAFARTTIAVSCQCSFYVDFIQESILVYGERTNVTELDLKDCVIVDGKVAPGTCWSAKGPAMANCQKEAQRYTPDQIRLPVVTIEEDACYGQIDNY